MSYDYNFPESMRIAEINNNRKVGTVARKFIQSGNNVASFGNAEFPLGSPAMGGYAPSGGGIGKKLRATKHGVTRLATDPVGFTKILVGAPVTSSNFQGDPSDPFGGKIHLGRALKKVGKQAVAVAAPIATKVATKYLEKAIEDMMKSEAEGAAAGAGMAGGKKGFKSFAKKIVSHPATKAMTQEALKIVIPIARNVAKQLMEEAVKSMMEGGEPEPAPAGGKGVFKKIGKSLGKVATNVGVGVGSNYIAAALMNPAVDEALLTGAVVGTEVVAEGAGKYSNKIRSVTSQMPGGRGRGRPRKMTGGAIMMMPDGSYRAVGSDAQGMMPRPRRIGGRLALGADPRTWSPTGGGLAKTVGRTKSAAGGGRGAIVSKIMRERGVSMPQASSIVKAEGLY